MGEDSSILSSIISPRSQQQPRNSHVHYWFHFRLFLFSVHSCLVALQALACPEKNLPGLRLARLPPFYKSWLRSCPTSPIHYQWRHDLLRSRYDCKLYVGNCRHAPTVVSLGSPCMVVSEVRSCMDDDGMDAIGIWISEPLPICVRKLQGRNQGVLGVLEHPYPT